MSLESLRPASPFPDRIAEIITIGDELLSGETVDTNSSYLDGLLEQWGWIVARHATVPDEVDPIARAMRDAADRASLVVCSGGLGPTEDDRTFEALAQALGCALVLDDDVLERIRARFASFGRTMTPNNERQARLPANGQPLVNEAGTAPGFQALLGRAKIYLLPGVPREVRWLAEHALRPQLDRGGPVIHRRTLKTIGFGESRLEHVIREVRDAHVGSVEFGYRAQASETHIKLSVRPHSHNETIDPDEARSRLDRAEADLRGVLGDAVFGTDLAEISAVLGSLLDERKLTVATAESCTGGLIGAMLTEVPGSSAYYLGGCVTYSNDAKVALLGVSPRALEELGAVCEVVARQMAEGVRVRLGSDWAIATTGVAGPTGGSPEKPVGTVHVAFAGPDGTSAKVLALPGDRASIRTSTARIALDQLRQLILVSSGTSER